MLTPQACARPIASPMRRANRGVQLVGGRIRQMGIAGRGLRLAMPEQLADEGEGGAIGGGNAGKGMPEVVQPHVLQFRQRPNPSPRLLQIDHVPTLISAWQHMQVVVEARQRRQHGDGLIIEAKRFAAGLGIRQENRLPLQVHIGPLQRQNLVQPRARQRQQPQGGDDEKVFGALALQGSQHGPEPRILLQCQIPLTLVFPVLPDFAAGV